MCVCVFLENDKTDLREFFSGFRRTHLFITTCIEKHCTRPGRQHWFRMYSRCLIANDWVLLQIVFSFSGWYQV